jgi:hypothetical protein
VVVAHAAREAQADGPADPDRPVSTRSTCRWARCRPTPHPPPPRTRVGLDGEAVPVLVRGGPGSAPRSWTWSAPWTSPFTVPGRVACAAAVPDVGARSPRRPGGGERSQVLGIASQIHPRLAETDAVGRRPGGQGTPLASLRHPRRAEPVSPWPVDPGSSGLRQPGSLVGCAAALRGAPDRPRAHVAGAQPRPSSAGIRPSVGPRREPQPVQLTLSTVYGCLLLDETRLRTWTCRACPWSRAKLRSSRSTSGRLQNVPGLARVVADAGSGSPSAIGSRDDRRGRRAAGPATFGLRLLPGRRARPPRPTSRPER